MEAVRPSKISTTNEISPPSYYDIIDNAPEPPTHSIILNNNDNEELINQVTSHGISDTWARIALRRCNGNVEDAIRLCIESGALEDSKPSSKPINKKKKGNVVSRTLGVLKLSGKNENKSIDTSQHQLQQQQQQQRQPQQQQQQSQLQQQLQVETESAEIEPPPSYHIVVSDTPSTITTTTPTTPIATITNEIRSNSFDEPPTYDEIIDYNNDNDNDNNNNSPNEPISSTKELNISVPIPPRPAPRKSSDPVPIVVSNDNSNSQSTNSVESSQTSINVSPPLLLSQTKKKSWKGWKSTNNSSDISPIYTEASISTDEYDCSNDIIVTDLRTHLDEEDINEIIQDEEDQEDQEDQNQNQIEEDDNIDVDEDDNNNDGNDNYEDSEEIHNDNNEVKEYDNDNDKENNLQKFSPQRSDYNKNKLEIVQELQENEEKNENDILYNLNIQKIVISNPTLGSEKISTNEIPPEQRISFNGKTSNFDINITESILQMNSDSSIPVTLLPLNKELNNNQNIIIKKQSQQIQLQQNEHNYQDDEQDYEQDELTRSRDDDDSTASIDDIHYSTMNDRFLQNAEILIDPSDITLINQQTQSINTDEILRSQSESEFSSTTTTSSSTSTASSSSESRIKSTPRGIAILGNRQNYSLDSINLPSTESSNTADNNTNNSRHRRNHTNDGVVRATTTTSTTTSTNNNRNNTLPASLSSLQSTSSRSITSQNRQNNHSTERYSGRFPPQSPSSISTTAVAAPSLSTTTQPSLSSSTTTTTTSSSTTTNTNDNNIQSISRQDSNGNSRRNRPTSNVSRSNSTQSQTLPAQLPSQDTNNTTNNNNNESPVVAQLNRPMSLSRLPRATAVTDNMDDDDTIHGEAYVPVVLDSLVMGTAVSDLYLHDESGGLYMAVAAPLTSVDDDDNDDDNNTVNTNNTNNNTTNNRSGRNNNVNQGEEINNQNRGIFSYARSRLYGDEQRHLRRREIEGGIKRRVFLPFDIEERDGKFFPVLYLTQPKLGTNNGPQHNRPSILRMTPSTNRNLSVRHAEVNTPPLWDGGNDRKECSICLHSVGMLYKIHHCRNCGHYVCNNCSKKDWLATMLPKTYVPEKETIVRVCDNCSYLQEGFIDSLRSGDLNRSMIFYLTGNVNLHCPMTIYKSEEFPIHTAIQGGNIHIVRWLIEDRRCSLRNGNGEPLKTSDGITPLAMAAYYGHRDIMQYLVQNHNCNVLEIKDPTILLRGLHAALESPGELPEGDVQSGLGSLFGRRVVPGELEPIETRSNPPSAPVSAQLATGNRNISHIPTTVAEAAPPIQMTEATSRPKLSQGKRRVINQFSIQQTRRTLVETSAIMPEVNNNNNNNADNNNGNNNNNNISTTPTVIEAAILATRNNNTSHHRRESSTDILDIQRAITAPYTDDDVSVMTPDMMSQFRQFAPHQDNQLNSSPDRNQISGHRRSRSVHSATSTALAVNNMSPISSADSLDRSPNIHRTLSVEQPRQITRFEVNSADFSRASPNVVTTSSYDDDAESVDTLMTSTHHAIDPIEANRMSMRASHQSMARLEAEEREAQNVLSRAASLASVSSTTSSRTNNPSRRVGRS